MANILFIQPEFVSSVHSKCQEYLLFIKSYIWHLTFVGEVILVINRTNFDKFGDPMPGPQSIKSIAFNERKDHECSINGYCRSQYLL